MHDWVMWPVSMAGRTYASLAEVRADPPSWPDLHLELLFDLLLDSPTFEVRTSGSTGTPKPLLVSKAAAAMSARATIKHLGVPHGSRLLLALDPQPIGGRMVMVRALATGMDLEACPAQALPEPPPGDYALTSLVPRQVQALLDESPETLRRMGQILVGGAPVDDALVQRLRGWPHPVWHTFGMTETLSHVALRRLDLGESEFNALPGCRFSQDAEGCLVIEAPWVEGLVVTRDFAHLVSESSFTWRGRADLAINSGGLKILPEPLEAEIRAQLGEHPLAITSVPDATWGEAVVLVSEAPLDISDLALADQRHRPRFHLVHALPLTKAGKLDRVALQNLVRTHPHLPRASYD
ncbi:MAG TPA: AMP-binding protein [Fimbriimonadaceae bacterium]|nr:O-succinylbenzoic acid--CoA ligase [Armatimonadota bacterium]HRD30101.1 AMP-binding protein [Fimbriimonadaceae bacterium]HRE94388.1 AMP-binding protein [Fimbriimonadaceae bacterium]HRI74571.1 AMP-binding protein [Fimbriimonadaceae bacterium]